MTELKVSVEGYTPTRIDTKPQRWSLFSGHLTAECAVELDGGPACSACLAYRLRGIDRGDRR